MATSQQHPIVLGTAILAGAALGVVLSHAVRWRHAPVSGSANIAEEPSIAEAQGLVVRNLHALCCLYRDMHDASVCVYAAGPKLIWGNAGSAALCGRSAGPLLPDQI